MPETVVPTVPTTVTCPGCGVEVAVGYPRCPKCHAVIPSTRTRRATFRDEAMKGGTSVVGEGEGAAPVGWIALAVAALVAIGLVIWLVSRDGGDKARPPVDTSAAVDSEEDEPTEVEDEDDDDEEVLAEGTRPGPDLAPAPPSPRAALIALDEGLRAAQLWAKVTRDGAVVVIESSLCEDAGMWPVVAEEAEALRAAGLARVRCIELHGGVVFERDL